MMAEGHGARLANLRPFGNDPGGLALSFSVERRSSQLAFAFELAGEAAADLEPLVVPPVAHESHQRRRDALWEHTCFEVFVGPADAPAYLELNLAPSGDWNVYAFQGYRAGMKPVSGAQPLLVRSQRQGEGARLIWHGLLRFEPGSPAGEMLSGSGDLVLGATAVLAYRSGERSYWALAHCGRKPDFHLRDSFVLRLARS